MITLNDVSKKNILDKTGMTVEEIIDTDFETIDEILGKKVGHKITEYLIDSAHVTRGQVYASENRFITMEEVDKGLSKHDRRKSKFIKENL